MCVRRNVATPTAQMIGCLASLILEIMEKSVLLKTQSMFAVFINTFSISPESG